SQRVRWFSLNPPPSGDFNLASAFDLDLPKLMFHAQGSPEMRGHQRPDDHNRGVGDSKLPVEYEPNPADNDRIQQWRRDQVGHGRAKFHPSFEHVYKHRDRRARTKRRDRP